MREIKFRGRTPEGKWIYGGISINYDRVWIDQEYYGDTFVDRETVGQYTGLKDKNGVEIYEGDIVNIDTYSYEEPELSRGFKVVYDEVKRMWLFVDLEDKNSNYTFENINSYYITEIEIIGNIYDNPELLKESEY